MIHGATVFVLVALHALQQGPIAPEPIGPLPPPAPDVLPLEPQWFGVREAEADEDGDGRRPESRLRLTAENARTEAPPARVLSVFTDEAYRAARVRALLERSAGLAG
ncbi:MAG: hypothetical protein AAFX79_10700 [Planctomycetota bacterium]